MMSRYQWIVNCVLWIVFAIPSLVLAAQSDEVDLASLVGSDVGACLEVKDFKTLVPEIRQSEFLDRLQQMALYRQWAAGRDFEKLQQARIAIEAVTGKPFGRFVDELLGERVILAAYSLPNREPAVVFLTQVSTVAALNDTVAVWNRMEPQRTTELSHRGHAYFRREKLDPKGKPVERQFYMTLGRTLALADDESQIQRVIDLSVERPQNVDATTAVTLRDSPTYRRAVEKLTIRRIGTLYLNPHAWDWAVAEEVRKDPLLGTVWKYVDGIVVGLGFDGGVVVESVVTYDSRPTDTVWQKVVARSMGHPAILHKIPARAIGGFSGRIDLNWMTTLLREGLNERERQQWKVFEQVSRGLLLGRSLFEDVLPRLGPNVGGYVVARDDLRMDAVPFEGVFAIELTAGDVDSESNGEPTLIAALDNALNTGFNLLASVYNSHSPDETALVRSKRTHDSSGMLRWVENLGPYQPAYSLTPGYLVVGSSRGVVQDFLSKSTEANITQTREFQRRAAESFPNGGQLLFVNVGQLRKFIGDHRQFLVEHVSANRGLDGDTVRARLAGFEDILGLVDIAFLAAEIGPHHIRVVAGAQVDAAPASEISDDRQ